MALVVDDVLAIPARFPQGEGAIKQSLHGLAFVRGEGNGKISELGRLGGFETP